jgi:hypothetical protein
VKRWIGKTGVNRDRANIKKIEKRTKWDLTLALLLKKRNYHPRRKADGNPYYVESLTITFSSK